MLSFFVELFFDISGSDHRGQFLFLVQNYIDFPIAVSSSPPFRSQNAKILTHVKHLIYIKMPPSGYQINGYNWLMVLLCRFSSYGFSLRAIGLLAVSDMPFLSN